MNAPLVTPTSNVPISPDQTAETYFGTNRDSNYDGTPDLNNGSYTFKPVAITQLPQNDWTLSGSWQISGQSITSQANDATLTFSVVAKDVYVVSGNANNQPISMPVGLPASAAGQYTSDDQNGNIVISTPDLYHIVSLHQFGPTDVTLTVPSGVSLYTFTFGS